jgi:ATP-dependent Lon protease
MLDKKINENFEGLVVRKDLAKKIKGNAIVPTYVLEYLLGQYCASDDEDNIQSGIETVKEILKKHYVHRNEAGLIKSIIREKSRHKIIDKISVKLNDKDDVYEASFANLGIKNVLVDPSTVKMHPKLLVSGVWCMADIEYSASEDKRICPWLMVSLKPIQLSNFDFESYLEKRDNFTSDEWIDLLIQSIGFEPSKLSKRNKLLALVRLIPFCERNYNLIELGAKGTGKSHIYSEFSPHGMLISGGEVTVPKLFVNNSSGKIGLVGYWDVVAFDEFAGRKKKANKALVDILKNYMANKTFSRGIETLGAEASLAFIGNTRHNLAYMLKHGDLFDELPEQYYDSAFLDRLHFYIPGWEVDIIRSELFTNGYGFVVDYLAEILRFLRNSDYTNLYEEYFSISDSLSTRDKDAVKKTFSGLMKIIYPHKQASKEQIEELLKFAMEGRKRVKQHLMRIDKTYASVSFEYLDNGQAKEVRSLEEKSYPQYFPSDHAIPEEEIPLAPGSEETILSADSKEEELKNNQLLVEENQTGISYEKLFGRYLQGVTKIVITDPYVRNFPQIRNMMELLEMISQHKGEADEIEIHLITGEDEYKPYQQDEYFGNIRDAFSNIGVYFTWEYDKSNTIHARHIILNNGWKISLDRGLDIFQHYEINNAFSLENKMQEHRKCKNFEVIYLRV